ncbi:hypothetical protein ACOBV9_18475 (plasmid) [Pseudoalteromonas espejiana]
MKLATIEEVDIGNNETLKVANRIDDIGENDTLKWVKHLILKPRTK